MCPLHPGLSGLTSPAFEYLSCHGGCAQRLVLPAPPFRGAVSSDLAPAAGAGAGQSLAATGAQQLNSALSQLQVTNALHSYQGRFACLSNMQLHRHVWHACQGFQQFLAVLQLRLADCKFAVVQSQIERLLELLARNTLPDVPDYCKDQSSAEFLQQVVTLAHKLCFTTFAPPGYVQGQTALRHFRPPAPQEWQLHATKLHSFASMQPSIFLDLQ